MEATLLQLHLQTCVPLAIAEIRAAGGLTEAHIQKCEQYSRDLGAHGDAILFYQKHATAEMVNKLVEAIAILAFVPGGITLFGLHFEVKKEETDG